MNKHFLFSLLLIVAYFPFPAAGMEKMSDQEMASVSGQAGVSLALDDVKLFASFQGLWLTDTDGPGAGTGASLGIADLSTMVQVNAITSFDSAGTATTAGLRSIGRALQGHYDPDLETTNIDDHTAFIPAPITIDATSRLPGLSAGATHNSGGTQSNVAGVRIGLGTMEVVLGRMEMAFRIEDTTPLDGLNSLGASNENFSLGTLRLGRTTLTVLGGGVEIAPH